MGAHRDSLLIKMRYPLPRGPKFIHNSMAALFFLLVWELCTCHGVQVAARGLLCGVRSLLPSLSGFQGSNFRCQAFPASIFTCWEQSFPVLIGLENSGFPCRRALCLHHLSLPCVVLGGRRCSEWRLWAPCMQNWISACSSSGCHQPI